MVFLPLIAGIILLVLLVTVVKLDTFISFILVCLFVGVTGGLNITESVDAIQKGIGSTLGSLVIILGFGAMLGKLVAESGAANTITNFLVKKFGIRHIQLALIVTGFIVGIPMFYTVGFVILVPLVIAIASNTKLPLLYVGLPMLASLSVTHGFLPPHPAPTAIAEMYNADLGLTLIYGIICGIPAILVAKLVLSRTMKRIQPAYLKEYVAETDERYKIPSVGTALFVALLPVLLIGGASLLQVFTGPGLFTEVIGNPAIAMLLSVLAAVYFLGVRTGRKMVDVMKILATAVSGVAVVLLIIAGAGALKQVMIETDISEQLGASLSNLGMPPLLMAWVIAALIRVSVGSATVAGLTAGTIMMPLIGTTGVSPELLVLATGAGSITLSHINDGGFWLFKEYFNVSIKETLLSWTLMETTVSVVGLLCVLLLNQII
ncbi:gluconate:H+ symporter [Fulvivirga sedimenti]|uniref:GntP family permease n=1 Tax=Fulvivirga sedimenti TaxID=2879465 RepID=A0A9X1HJB8_9BACT|nr:gluconate:H+ symporter [Fulvivirga sedimenti]MCA6073239.1 GntP family permease [Fulvivirga sedimenti]